MVPFSPLSMPYRVQVQARTGTTPRVKSKSNDRVQRTELRRMSSIKTQFNGALDVVTRWIRESSIDHVAASINLYLQRLPARGRAIQSHSMRPRYRLRIIKRKAKLINSD